MRPINFPGANAILRPPDGHEDDVDSLPIQRGFEPRSNMPIIASVWELSEQEVEALVRTRRLRIVHWGGTIPPVLPMVADESGVAIEFNASSAQVGK
jgi:hypothetical protein